ncbi:MAG TPA: RNA 2',3'-cyclic phosphodiesterase [Candidatus Omnitrophota bacterium]|nr:RNA 2',3'-cyclic phosphodiesterase [Candidatus Omnitrophota bacterium]
MRTFIAIELSEQIKNTLAQVQSHLRYAGADVKWVSEENIHLTIKFLGEITEEKCAKVSAVLDDTARQTKAFEFSLKDIGAFPKIEFPKVIWVGLDKGAKESAELAARIDRSLSEMGFAVETRPFTAHLTIGRVRSPKNKAVLKDKILSYRLQPATPNIISSVILFKSVLTPHGPVYTKLHESYFLPEN